MRDLKTNDYRLHYSQSPLSVLNQHAMGKDLNLIRNESYSLDDIIPNIDELFNIESLVTGEMEAMVSNLDSEASERVKSSRRRHLKRPVYKYEVSKCQNLLLHSSFKVGSKEIIIGIHPSSFETIVQLLGSSNQSIEMSENDFSSFLDSTMLQDLRNSKSISEFLGGATRTKTGFKPMMYRGGLNLQLRSIVEGRQRKMLFNKDDGDEINRIMELMKYTMNVLNENRIHVFSFVEVYNQQCFKFGVQKLNREQMIDSSLQETPKMDFNRLFIEYPLVSTQCRFNQSV